MSIFDGSAYRNQQDLSEFDCWEEASNCSKLADPDKNVFYADTSEERQLAKRYCLECPVRLLCLQTALERGEVWGVWGGCDEIELRRTLWVDTNGSRTQRQRYPRCPACKAGTIRLIAEENDVQCQSCNFHWESKTSAQAINQFWGTQNQEQPKSQRQKIRVSAAAARTRIPTDRKTAAARKRNRTAAPAFNLPKNEVRTVEDVALAASAGLTDDNQS